MHPDPQRMRPGRCPKRHRVHRTDGLVHHDFPACLHRAVGRGRHRHPSAPGGRHHAHHRQGRRTQPERHVQPRTARLREFQVQQQVQRPTLHRCRRANRPVDRRDYGQRGLHRQAADTLLQGARGRQGLHRRTPPVQQAEPSALRAARALHRGLPETVHLPVREGEG